MLVELLSPLFSDLFLVLMCMASFMRAIVGVAGGATRATLVRHQARQVQKCVCVCVRVCACVRVCVCVFLPLFSLPPSLLPLFPSTSPSLSLFLVPKMPLPKDILVLCACCIVAVACLLAADIPSTRLFHGARRCNNMADVSAKDGSQETLVNLAALLVSLFITPLAAASHVSNPGYS